MHQIPVFVITGGPCAGKSTGLSLLRDHLSNLGYTVFIAKEAATSLIGSGIIPNRTVSNELFQELVFKKILSDEAVCMKAAKNPQVKKPVVICDRGLMDGLAYTTSDHFSGLCTQFRGDITKFRDKRYRAVMHLRTSALGAEAFYSLENNSARTEAPKEARALDERTMKAWVGHPHLRVIANKPNASFESKMEELQKEVCHVLGEPVPLEIERKYLVEIPDWTKLPHYERVTIEQRYLIRTKNGAKRRIRARGQNGSWFYTETTKRKITEITRVETERILSSREYHYLRATALDPSRIPIVKHRHCFVWKHQYFELDVFVSPVLPHALLEIELMDEAQIVRLPPFLKIVKEVSDNPRWTNSTIARHGAPT